MSPGAKSFLDGATAKGEQVAVSAISLVEMVYLIEKGRIDTSSLNMTAAFMVPPALFLKMPVDREVVASMRRIARADVSDMPDRIIAATAVQLGVPLISRDRKISASSVFTIW